MKTILLFGAGKSATSLIEYLGIYCSANDCKLQVCDSDLSLAESKTKDFPNAEAISFDVNDEKKRHNLISKSDVVISLLPPSHHFLVAKDCVVFSKHFLTASYLDENIKTLKNEIENKELIFLGEMGLDPGMDHISAMKMVNDIKKHGGKITSFKSYCGGLVAPESDDNPWHYKITWNPANVVMAGSTGAVYRKEGRTIEVPYTSIFSDENNIVDVQGLLPLAWYANRDSLSYMDTYQLQNVSTFLRATLRYPSFCRGWNKIVRLGLTDTSDHEKIKNSKTFEDWFHLKKRKLSPKEADELWDQEFTDQINFLSLTSTDKIPIPVFNSALLLQYLFEEKLVMKPDDKDMVVMVHEVEYCLNGRNKRNTSSLVIKGTDRQHTAMARTVGLPLAIAAQLILENKIQLKGLHIPVVPEIYEPVLRELEENGIRFKEDTKEV